MHPTRQRRDFKHAYVFLAQDAVMQGFLENAKIARVLDVPPATLMRWRERYPVLEKAIGEALVKLLAEVEGFEPSSEGDKIIERCCAELDRIADRTGTDYRDLPDARRVAKEHRECRR